jgi:hypothetical protein
MPAHRIRLRGGLIPRIQRVHSKRRWVQQNDVERMLDLSKQGFSFTEIGEEHLLFCRQTVAKHLRFAIAAGSIQPLRKSPRQVRSDAVVTFADRVIIGHIVQKLGNRSINKMACYWNRLVPARQLSVPAFGFALRVCPILLRSVIFVSLFSTTVGGLHTQGADALLSAARSRRVSRIRSQMHVFPAHGPSPFLPGRSVYQRQ